MELVKIPSGMAELLTLTPNPFLLEWWNPFWNVGIIQNSFGSGKVGQNPIGNGRII